MKQDENGAKYVMGIPLYTIITWIVLAVITIFAFKDAVFSGTKDLAYKVTSNVVEIKGVKEIAIKNTNTLNGVVTEISSMKGEYSNELKNINKNIDKVNDNMTEIRNDVKKILSRQVKP